MDLQAIWFVLVAVLITGYAILDGFDLGVGVLHLFERNEQNLRLHLNAIAPVWDGNEVWLLTGGGALFAAFPLVYATVFSGFYIALMLLLFALIMRAVSMEFRGKVNSPSWRRFWDRAFGLGSLLSAFLLGVAFGNILMGLPINREGVFTGSFLGLLQPYALLIGFTSVVLFGLHGAAYLSTKCGGALQERSASWSLRGWAVFVILYLLSTYATSIVSPFLFDGFGATPLSWAFLALFVVSAAGFPVAVKRKAFSLAFLGSSTLIAAIFGLSALSLFPRLAPSSIDLRFSLTAYNASSTDATLGAMLIIAAIGMPLVILYTVLIHRFFRGPVVLDEDSY